MVMSTRTTDKFVEFYLESLDCPRALTVWLLFSNKEHDQLCELDIDSNAYIDFVDFRHAYLATKFLSKATFLQTTFDKKEKALAKFFEAEDACRLINERGYHWITIKRDLNERLHSAIIRKIDFLLGDFDADEMIDSANWGPGVTLDIKGVDTSPVKKFQLEVGTTRPLDDLMGSLYATAYPIWNLSKRKIHKGSKVITVPKSSKIDRTIAVEPGLNLWFQKGVGSMIRRRLIRVGLNLNSQDRNQSLSRLGSKFDKLATVDFSSASDTIATSTVRELLPNRWFAIMDILRSRFGSVGKKSFMFEKFSSMGNGFTFELETLIFYAIAMECCRYLHIDSKEVSVYGDDVILPSSAYDLFVKTSKFYGFSVNTTKSFSSGCFRESCGAHWFEGKNCKPYFLKEVIRSEFEIYLAANSVRRVSYNREIGYCDATLYRPWQYLRNKLRKPLFISEGYGDGGFIVNFDEATPSRAKHGIEGYLARSLISIPLGYNSEEHSVLLARLRGRSLEIALGNQVNLRNRVRKSRKRILIRQWVNLGPWL